MVGWKSWFAKQKNAAKIRTITSADMVAHATTVANEVSLGRQIYHRLQSVARDFL